MPQGGIDTGEDPRAAALRESDEETGVTPDLVTVEAETEGWVTYDLPQDIVPRIWKGRYKRAATEMVPAALSRQRRSGADRSRTEHPEFSEWRWMPHRTRSWTRSYPSSAPSTNRSSRPSGIVWAPHHPPPRPDGRPRAGAVLPAARSNARSCSGGCGRRGQDRRRGCTDLRSRGFARTGPVPAVCAASTAPQPSQNTE